jgi:hypothetical protein
MLYVNIERNIECNNLRNTKLNKAWGDFSRRLIGRKGFTQIFEDMGRRFTQINVELILVDD